MTLFDALPAFAAYLLHEEALSPGTVREYRADGEKLANWLLTHDENLADWERVGARELRLYIHKFNPAPARARRLISSWKKLWKYLEGVEKRPMQRGPDELKIPKMQEALPKPLSREELSRLFATARENPNEEKALRDWAILAFLYGTGLRVSEALNLKIADVGFEAGDALPVTIRVVAKGNIERQVYLSSTAQRSLYQWLKVRRVQAHGNSPYVFVHLRTGKQIPVRTVQAMMHRVCARAGIPKERATPHKLRHSFGTELNEVRPLEEVADAMGHKNINTTRRYAKVRSARLKAAAEALPDVM